jgi:agmatine deiminase
LPVFGGDATDSDHKAIEMLSDVFPRRKVVAVDGLELVKEGGNVHCITQQVPCGMEGGYQ